MAQAGVELYRAVSRRPATGEDRGPPPTKEELESFLLAVDAFETLLLPRRPDQKEWEALRYCLAHMLAAMWQAVVGHPRLHAQLAKATAELIAKRGI